jgi:ABC-type glycerol-3-phosphate transport system substrate-binding protein
MDRPPATWDEFERACRELQKLDIRGYPLSVDASTLNGMIYSFGGRVISEDGKRTLYDSPESVALFEMLERFVKSGIAYQINRQAYEDRFDFENEKAAFFFRSSTAKPFLEEGIGGRFNWAISALPRKEGVEPVTVLFGPNIALFKHNEARQRAAWRFINYFTRPEITAEWAMKTGYLPVRRSALKVPAFQEYLQADPRNRALLDILEVARPEPNVDGWQQVRVLAEQAMTKVIRGVTDAHTAAQELTREANAVIEKTRR